MDKQKFHLRLEKLQLKNFPKREELYLRMVRELVAEIENTTNTEPLLKQLKALDKVYFAQQGSPIAKQILFFRHGKCSRTDKGLGLKPNALVNEKAIDAMQGTSAQTEALLHAPDGTPKIIVSPLVRALQTCERIVFTRDKNKPHISINPVLAENSRAPSGSDVRTFAQFLEMGQKQPFFSRPRFIFWLARMRYGLGFNPENRHEFLILQKKRDEVIDQLKAKSSGGIDEREKDSEQSRDVSLKASDKIQGIHDLIKNEKAKDLILVGHGQNFKAYFKEVFADKSSFKYGEGRSLYLLENGKVVAPPYKLSINQQTGKVEVEYTGKIAIKDMQDKLKPEIVKPNPLAKLGGTPPVDLDSASLSHTQTEEEGYTSNFQVTPKQDQTVSEKAEITALEAENTAEHSSVSPGVELSEEETTTHSARFGGS